MANDPQFADATVIAGLAAQGALMNTGFLEIYSGTQPTDANTAIGAQVLLATLAFSATAWGTPVASGSPGSRTVTMTANTITGANAGATGTAAWARMYASNGTTVVADCSVGTASTDIVLNTVALVSGIPVSVTSLTITRPET
jgi:hypothetical protein